MAQGTITCPSCGNAFELSDALTHQIRDRLKTELQADVVKREAEAKRKLDEVKAKEDALAKARDALNEEVEKQLKQKLGEAEAKAAKKVEGKFTDQLKELQDVLKEKDDSIKTFRENELELRKKQRELEKAKEEAELEIQRTLDEERGKIRQEVEGKAQEQHRLKDLEKDKVINDLNAALEDMKRKADQGSMETQGEVLEQEFEAQLKRFFVHDDIQPVPKGIRGADLIHTVRTPLGADCGVLLWETRMAIRAQVGRFTNRNGRVNQTIPANRKSLLYLPGPNPAVSSAHTAVSAPNGPNADFDFAILSASCR